MSNNSEEGVGDDDGDSVEAERAQHKIMQGALGRAIIAAAGDITAAIVDAVAASARRCSVYACKRSKYIKCRYFCSTNVPGSTVLLLHRPKINPHKR